VAACRPLVLALLVLALLVLQKALALVLPLPSWRPSGGWSFLFRLAPGLLLALVVMGGAKVVGALRLRFTCLLLEAGPDSTEAIIDGAAEVAAEEPSNGVEEVEANEAAC